MDRRHFFAVVSTLVAFCATARRAIAWDLITKEEFERDNTGPRPKAIIPPTQPGAPLIEVEAPDVTKPIKSPFTIKLNFRPQDGATIIPTTFRAKYGWLGIDITDRLAAHAQINASGLTAANAGIPPGQYRVTIQITDNRQRVGTRILEFTVV